MASLIKDGMDLREAERAAAIVAATLRDESVDPAAVDKLLQEALERTNGGFPFRHDDHLISENLRHALTESYRAACKPRLPPEGLTLRPITFLRFRCARRSRGGQSAEGSAQATA